MFKGQPAFRMPLRQAKRLGSFYSPQPLTRKRKRYISINIQKLLPRTSFVIILFFLIFYSQPVFNLPLPKNIIVKADQQEQTQNIESNALPFATQLPHPGYISTYFSAYHPGIDLATGLGMPIHPIADGTVITAGYDFTGYGLTVVLDHGYGYTSRYAHMGEIYVTVGEKVTRDQLLGVVGLTGHTTGPHTHLEVTHNGVKINPLTILPPVRTYPTQADFQAVSTPKPVSEPQIAQDTQTQTIIPSSAPQPELPKFLTMSTPPPNPTTTVTKLITNTTDQLPPASAYQGGQFVNLNSLFIYNGKTSQTPNVLTKLLENVSL